jgi:hypothetical protein
MAKPDKLQVRQAALLYTRIAERKSGETEAMRTARIMKACELLEKLPEEARKAGRQQAYENTGATGGGPKIERVGRRADLLAKGEATADTLFIKVTICGSGYDKWIIQQTGLDGGWAELGTKAIAYGKDREAEGKGWELMLAGTASAGTKALGGKGALDAGTNTIADLHTEAVNLVSDIVKFHGKDKQGKERPLHVFIRAHSRGAVAGGQVATSIKAACGDATKVEVVDFDPVPGPEMLSNKKRKSGDKNYTEMDLSAVDESTVVYSIASGYAKKYLTDGLFTPQKILGAKRVIISQQNHSAGLLNGVVYEGKRYKGSAINSLPEGVFVDPNADGQTVNPIQLVMGRDEFDQMLTTHPKWQARDAAIQQGKERVREVSKASGRTSDTDRLKIIDEVLKEFYSRA